MLKSMSVRATLIALACVMSFSAHAIADAARQIAIPAGDLRQALLKLSKEYGAELVYQPQEVQSYYTSGVSGTYTAPDAVRILLKGTPLELRVDPSGAMAIVPAHMNGTSAQPSGQDEKERKSNSSDEFRVAQATPGQAAGAAAVAAPNSEEGKGPAKLEEIVVTAQKREERLQDVPISISVLTGDALNKAPYQGVTEALGTVPGVAAFPWSQGGGTFISVRGVAAGYPLFGGSSPIAYYLDGVPFGFVDSAIAPDANAYDLQRVEVLRGPQGTLYGASALNGVVRVLTNDADLNNFDFTARAADSGTDGGGNNYRGDLALNVPIAPGVVAARAVFGYQNWSGWIDKPTQENANDAILRNARLKINAQPTDEFSIAVSAWLSHQDYGAPSIANDEGKSHHMIPEPISTDYGAYGLKLAYAFPAFSITSTTSYLNYSESDTLDYIDFVGFSTALDETMGAHVVSEEINLTSNLSGPWRWSAGAIYRDAANSTFQTLPQFAATLDWTDTSKSYAVFGEIGRRFLDNQFEWTLGGRYFHDQVTTQEGPDAPPLDGVQYYRSEASFNSTTPRAVLSWYPVQDTTIYASFSEGFRSGAPQAYYIVGGVEGFPPVKPDKLYNYEIGAKTDLLEHRLSLDAAVYYMDWKDVQQQLIVPFHPPTLVTALVNGQSASGAGIDLGLTARPLDRLELGVTFNWNDLTVDKDVISAGEVLFAKGDRLNFSAKYTAGGSLSYLVPFGSTGLEGRLTASANYTSALLDRAIVGGMVRTASGDNLLIARTSLSIRSQSHWEVGIFADNITNEHGAVTKNPSDISPMPDTSVRIRPRTIGLQVDYHYQ